MGDQANATRASLLLRLRDHDDAAWMEFFRIYTPAVYGYAKRRGLQANDAEDLAQEVLVEVARCIRNFEYQPEKGRFRDWLGSIVWRRLTRYWQAQKTPAETVNPELQAGLAESSWVDEYQASILSSALTNIQPHFAETTWLAFLGVWKDGERATEVSVRLGIPVEVVYNAKSRVLKQLETEVLRISDDYAWLPK